MMNNMKTYLLSACSEQSELGMIGLSLYLHLLQELLEISGMKCQEDG